MDTKEELVRLANEINSTKSNFVKLRDVFEITCILESMKSQGTIPTIFGDKTDEIIGLLNEVEKTKSDWVKIRNLVEAILLATGRIA